ncbi:MAG: hypothetical protein IB617_00905 [Candidatus Nealsonbacteria bacterium]|nr:MAG: hypothetical protein IB617_00905 [Candidatus Nealsonbacteria bacterium]
MKDYKTLILIILFILLLSFITWKRFETLQEPFSLYETNFPKFEMPKFESFFSQEDKGSEEFVSPDGKLKLKYSSNWIKMEEESLETFNKEIAREGAKNLFFAQKSKIEENALAILIVQELTLEKEISLEEIIEEMKEKTKEKDGEMEIEKSEFDDKIAYLEVKYKRDETPIFYSKEKIILEEDKAYLIIFLNSNNNWSGFEEEINEIFNSIQIID